MQHTPPTLAGDHFESEKQDIFTVELRGSVMIGPIRPICSWNGCACAARPCLSAPPGSDIEKSQRARGRQVQSDHTVRSRWKLSGMPWMEADSFRRLVTAIVIESDSLHRRTSVGTQPFIAFATERFPYCSPASDWWFDSNDPTRKCSNTEAAEIHGYCVQLFQRKKKGLGRTISNRFIWRR